MLKCLRTVLVVTSPGDLQRGPRPPITAPRGKATLDIIVGGDSALVLAKLNEFAPELGGWITNFAYGDVVSRPQLDLRSRELATVAALTAMGHAQPQLKAHIKGALNAGLRASGNHRGDYANGGLCGLPGESEWHYGGARSVRRTGYQTTAGYPLSGIARLGEVWCRMQAARIVS